MQSVLQQLKHILRTDIENNKPIQVSLEDGTEALKVALEIMDLISK